MRATARQISFADWELMRQGDRGVRLEPLLDDQRDVIECIRRDLVRGLKQPGSGRHGLTATQVLRSLVLMRLKNWDYRELRERIADGLTLRQFTDFYCAPVPKHDAFQRGFIRLTPQTLKVVNDLLVRAAVELGLEDGAKLRVDTTVVQTDIHHPTDNTLLWDVVRVVTRLIGRLAAALERAEVSAQGQRLHLARHRRRSRAWPCPDHCRRRLAGRRLSASSGCARFHRRPDRGALCPRMVYDSPVTGCPTASRTMDFDQC